MAERIDRTEGEEAGGRAAFGAGGFEGPDPAGGARSSGGVMAEVAIELIDPAPDNPRASVGDVGDLAASIRSVGILQRLLVVARPGGRYLLVAGARRLAAAPRAGLATVPIEIRDLDDRQRAAAMLVENLQREDLSPIEEARGYRRLVDELRVPGGQRGLAKMVGKSQAHISKRLALLVLPDEVTEAVEAGTITVGDASELAKLGAHPERVAAAFAHRERSGGVARAVEAEERQMVRAARIDQLRTQAEAQGLTLIDTPSLWNPLDGPTQLAHIGVDEAAHRSESCHAVTISDDYWEEPAMRAVCTDPKAHRDLAGEEATRAARRAEMEQERREEEAHIDARRAHGAQLVAAAKGDDGVALAARLWLLGAPDPDVALVEQLLGLRAETEAAHPETMFAHLNRRVLAKASGREAKRAIYAAALAVGELALDRPWGHEEAAGVYVAHLEATGWALNDDEHKTLKAHIEHQEATING